jgi:hypothetical protein
VPPNHVDKWSVSHPEIPHRDGGHNALCKSRYILKSSNPHKAHPSMHTVCSIVSAAAPRIDKASRTLENRRFSLLKDKAFQ